LPYIPTYGDLLDKKKKRKLSPQHHNSGRSEAWAKLQRWVDVLLKVEIVLG